MREESLPTGETPQGGAGPEPKHILVVEDNEDYTMLIQDALESRDEGYVITCVSSPEQALDALDRQEFDLVLLDYKFPRGNGLEIIRRLKGMTPFIPAVMITAFGSEEVAIEAMREGALDFLPKTRDFLQTLPDVVRRVLDRSRIIRERMRTREALERRNRELHVLNHIASILNRSLRLDWILGEALAKVLELTSLEGGWVLLKDKKERLEAVASRGFPSEAEARPEGKPFEELHETVLHYGRACLRPGPSVGLQEGREASHLLIPLQAGGRVLGVMHLVGSVDRSYPYSEMELLTGIGKQVGVAVENGRLYQELERTKLRLEDLVDNAGDGIITVDEEGRILSWNNGAAAITGYTENEVLGTMWEGTISEERRAEARSLRRRVLEGRTVSNYETVRRHKDGDRIDLAVTLSPLRDEEGRVVGVSSLEKDITRRRQLQEQLIQVEKMAAVGQLISGVAHELNNPLTAVIGYSQLIATARTGEKQEHYLDNIAKEAMRCQRIVQNLLTFAREHRPEKRLLDLNEVVHSTLELRGYELRIKNVEVSTELAEDLPPVQADHHQLQQVLMNIVTNAEQAMEEQGEGALRLCTERWERGGDAMVRLVVEDSGPGIADEHLNKIFEPFFTTKDVGQGTGLGLSLSYGIMQSHGGTIYARNRSGGGARFVLELPAQTVSGEIDEIPEAVPEPSEEVREPSPQRILVVDDEPSIREMFQEVLEMKGHEVQVAVDGQQALELIDQQGESYALIIADLKMPRVGGKELYRTLRSRHPDLADRVIFSTGDVISASSRSFLDETGREVISKPCGAAEIHARVRRFFEGGRTEAEVQQA